MVDLGMFPSIQNECNLQQCGSFMGEPMSYMTLTLMNLLTEVISQKYFDAGKEVFSGLSKEEWMAESHMDPFVIAGDDKLALRFSKARATISREASVGLGFVMSDKDGDSNELLIFCEDHILIDRQEQTKLVFVDVLKGRLLTNVHRGHADNRASIFGKGRMISLQCAWINETVKKYVLSLHFNLFVRTYGVEFINAEVPWFFPPSLGGLGLEPVTIPKWGYRYINYIIEVLNIKDWRVRMTLLWELASLSSAVHRGVLPRKISLERASEALAHIKPSFLDEFDKNRNDLIFQDEEFIKTMKKEGIVPTPLNNEITHEDVVIYAEQNGFTEVNSLLDQFERIDTFQQMLEAPTKPVRRTAKMWQRKSSRFWKKKHLTRDVELDSRFKSLADLEHKVTHHFHGFCSKALQDELLKNGPSMLVPSSKTSERRMISKIQMFSGIFPFGRRLPVPSAPQAT
jgi:hypothetical protein